MARGAAIGVDDDLSTRQATIAHRSADLETARRVNVKFGVFADPLGRQHGFDDFFHDAFLQVAHLDVGAVLRRQHHGVDSNRLVVFVDECDLALGVWPQERQDALFSHLSLSFYQAVRKRDGSRHQHVGFIRCVAEHQTLVPGALLLGGLPVNAQGDVRRLLADGIQHGA